MAEDTDNIKEMPYDGENPDDDYRSGKDEEPLYVLPDEDAEEVAPDKTGSPEKKDGPSPLMLMFKVMFNPVEGWKAVRRADYTPDEFAGRCFYPMLALAAVSQFSAFYQTHDAVLASVLMKAAETFMSFFFGYFIIMILGRFFPDEVRARLSSSFGKTFVMMLLSTYAFFDVFITAVSGMRPILVFLPIWTIYLASKGVKFLRVPREKEMRVFTLVTLAVILVPVVLSWLMGKFI